MEEGLARISGVLSAELGLNLPPQRFTDLRRALAAAAGEWGLPGPEAALGRLLQAPLSGTDLDVMARLLTIGETYFFREKATLDAISNHIFPALLAERRRTGRRLRIWSAGCCTGEEPYTLAILLLRHLADWRQWNITVLGTDVNRQFLRQAAEAVYGPWSFRDAPPWLQQEYFTEVAPRRFALQPEVRQLVRFEYLNLAATGYPASHNGTAYQDLIVCRNVLMYFTEDAAGRVVERLYDSLQPDGWLVPSITEAGHRVFAPLARITISGTHLYQRKSPLSDTANSSSPVAGYGSTPVAKHATPLPGAAPSDPASPAPALEHFKDLLQKGSLQEAALELESLPPGTPDLATAWHQLARQAADRGDLTAALRWCDAAVETDKLNPAHYYMRASILQEAGNEGAATRALQDALYLDHDFVMAHYALGNLHRRQGRRAQAMRHFANALQLLQGYAGDATVPESSGLRVERLRQLLTDQVNR